MTSAPGRLLFQERRCKADGNAEIGAAEAADHSEGYTDDASLAVQDRAAGASGGGLRVVNDFVGQDIADVSLGDQRSNQVAAGEFVKNQLRVPARHIHDLLDGVITGAGENGVETSSIAEANHGLTADRSLFARIELQDRPLQYR